MEVTSALFAPSFGSDEIKLFSRISAKLCLLGVEKKTIVSAINAAKRNRSSFLDELCLLPGLGEELVFRTLAEVLQLNFVGHIPPNQLALGSLRVKDLIYVRQVMVSSGLNQNNLCITPDRRDLQVLARNLTRAPLLRQYVQICTPSTLTTALRKRMKNRLAQIAQDIPDERFSSKKVITGWQAFIFSQMVFWFLWASFKFPWQFWLQSHIVFLFLFFGCNALRMGALFSAPKFKLNSLNITFDGDEPVYSILVPLYKESCVIGQLLEALSALKWPASKLDIKIICEEDDTETLEALCKYRQKFRFDLVKVPDLGPRTKPKALNYALQTARGDLAVIYDAEDRPHPCQLIEAWQFFRSGGPKLACLQAPLIISNAKKNWLTKMFAFEYIVLFFGMFPWLCKKNLPVPLGGSSNHFRCSCLRQVGGWSSYNVTEDAELGLRLARTGFQTKMLTHGTLEDAPENLKDWKNQRTRWFKGWMQTWLVQMRHPFDCCRKMGLVNFLVSQLYMTGLILSALLFPLVFVVFFLILLLSLGVVNLVPGGYGLLFLDIVGLSMACFCYIALGFRAFGRRQKVFFRLLIYLPVYWILLCFAAWRSLFQLFKNPHVWEKTPHFPNKRYESRGTKNYRGKKMPIHCQANPSLKD